MTREEAIARLKNIAWLYGSSEREQNIQAINMAIEALSAERTGEWLPFEYGDDTWHKCSVCGVADRYVEVCQRPDGTIGRTAYVRHFCPNCGADMRGK